MVFWVVAPCSLVDVLQLFAVTYCSFLRVSKQNTAEENQVIKHTWSDIKVHELATVCLPWQHWTKALVWFDDDISEFHSCVVVVELWQSFSE